jgi:VanZ family protein
MTRAQIVFFRLLFIAAVAAITYLATTRQEVSLVGDFSDKTNHVLAFYVLTLLIDYSFPQKALGHTKVLPLLAYGALIEITQGFLPHRTPSLLDLFADGVGIAMYPLSLPLLKQLPMLGRR